MLEASSGSGTWPTPTIWPESLMPVAVLAPVMIPNVPDVGSHTQAPASLLPTTRPSSLTAVAPALVAPGGKPRSVMVWLAMS